MAYPNYYPQFYPSAQPTMPLNAPQMPANGTQTNNGGILWVQGESAAKAYPVASGASVLLMDSENPVMYIKSTDTSGMPQPLRIFDYTERTNAPDAKNNNDDFVSRSEFDEFKEEIKKTIKGIRKPRLLEEVDE